MRKQKHYYKDEYKCSFCPNYSEQFKILPTGVIQCKGCSEETIKQNFSS